VSNGSTGTLAPAEIRAVGEGSYGVAGPMTFHSVTGLWRESQRLFDTKGGIKVDLDEVTHTDSAGLALLIEWQRNAIRDGYRVEFLHLPAQMIQLASVTNLDSLLSGEHSETLAGGS
jgi:phospholipid transport system transporter-binding protein